MASEIARLGRGKRQARSKVARNRVAYAYISPFYVLFAIFGLFPLLMAVALGFFEWRGAGLPVFIGLENYRRIFFVNPDFGKSLVNTLIMGVGGNIINLFGALVLAYILNSKLVRFANLFKTLYFMPMVTSAVASAIIFKSLFNERAGIINQLLESLGFGRVDWLSGTGTYLQIVVIIMFAWQWLGWNLVIYLSGMKGISSEIIEAAVIDGASHPRIFFNITLPILKPILLFTFIQSTVGTFSIFIEPFMLTGANRMDGGPGGKGYTSMMFMLRSAPLESNNYGFASAIANVLCIIIVIMSFVFTALLQEKSTARKKKRKSL